MFIMVSVVMGDGSGGGSARGEVGNGGCGGGGYGGRVVRLRNLPPPF